MTEESDRFKHEYHKYADEQVRNRALGDAMGRLRMAVFVAAVGPGACILMNTMKYAPSNLVRYAIQGTALLAVVILVLNYVRLPGKARSSGMAVSILVFTLLLAGATYPLARLFSLLPA